MINHYFALAIVFVANLITPVFGAVTVIHQESFESAPSPTTYQLVGSFNDDANDYFDRISDTHGGFFPNPDNEDGTFYIAGEDMDSEGIPSGIGEVNFETVDVTGFHSIEVKLLVVNAIGTDLEVDDYIKIYATVDGAPEQLIGAYYGIGSNTLLHKDDDLDGTGDTAVANNSNFKEFSVSLPTATTSVKMRVEIRADGSGEEFAIDNLRILGAPEPSSFMMMLMSSMLMLVRRKR